MKNLSHMVLSKTRIDVICYALAVSGLLLSALFYITSNITEEDRVFVLRSGLIISFSVAPLFFRPVSKTIRHLTPNIFYSFTYPNLRLAALYIASISAILLIHSSLTYGFGEINAKTMRGDPNWFLFVYMGPMVVFVFSSLVFFLPKIIFINLVVLLCLLGATDLIFGAYVYFTPKSEYEEVDHSRFDKNMTKNHNILGFSLNPDNKIDHKVYYRGELLYEVTYSVDDHGRRVTPVTEKSAREEFILFFGGSNTFGAGLNDSETLPAAVGRLTMKFQPYNYGVPGYGPSQMLDILKERTLRSEVKQDNGIAVFLYVPRLWRRVIGDRYISSTWGRYFSNYVVDKEGNLTRSGNFSERPFKSVFYAIISMSNIIRYFHVRIPGTVNDYHLGLTADVFRAAKAELKKQYNGINFYVLLRPGGGAEKDSLPLASFLKDRGIKILDYTALYDQSENIYQIHDGHSSALANARLAERLVEDLNLTSDQNPTE